jgi:hypothetical protein
MLGEYNFGNAFLGANVYPVNVCVYMQGMLGVSYRYILQTVYAYPLFAHKACSFGSGRQEHKLFFPPQ